MDVTKIKLLFILVLIPLVGKAQFLGFGQQYSEGAHGQFVANMSFPTFHHPNKLNTYVSSGLEFTTSGGAKMSGLHLKPLQITTFFSEDFFNDHDYSVLLGVDAGYLYDFRRGRKNDYTVTPNLYFDYKVFFVKAGYDIGLTKGQSQFFIRAGIGIGLSTFKMFATTKIW